MDAPLKLLSELNKAASATSASVRQEVQQAVDSLGTTTADLASGLHEARDKEAEYLGTAQRYYNAYGWKVRLERDCMHPVSFI